VPIDQVVRMHYSSGTTGTATAIYHTADDLQHWAECVARGMLRVGVTSEDVFQNMMGYGLFTGGLGLHYPAELIGCLTIPAGAGHTSRQIEIMKTFGTTALHILPSYGLRLAHSCREAGVVPQRDLSLRWCTTSMVFRRCAGRVWPLSALLRKACICVKTIIWPRLSHPIVASRCPRGRRANWCLPP